MKMLGSNLPTVGQLPLRLASDLAASVLVVSTLTGVAVSRVYKEHSGHVSFASCNLGVRSTLGVGARCKTVGSGQLNIVLLQINLFVGASI